VNADPAPSPSHSTFGQDAHGGGELRRVTSVRSNYSDRSAGFYTSNSASVSVTSFASSSGTGGSGAGIQRRIVPLYNLSAHNVMTNTVTDAGTDAKVAKFQRRGLEIMRVGTWEPIEVWSSKASTSSGGRAPSSQRQYQTVSSSAAAASHAAAIPATTTIDDVGRLLRASSLTSGGQELNATAFSMVSDGTGKESSVPSSPSFMKKLASSASGSGHKRQNSIDPSVPGSPPPPSTSTPNNAKEVAAGAKKFFGKVFNTNSSKKRDGGGSSLNFASFNLSTTPGSATGQRTSLSASVGAGGRDTAARRLSSLSSGSKESHSDSTSASHIAPAQQHSSTLLHPPLQSYSSGHWQGERDPPPLQPPVLGVQAALHASVAPGTQLNGRPSSYVWVLRKWAKEKQLAGSHEGILKGLVNAAQGLQPNAGVSSSHQKDKDKDVHADVEVRFEWSRGRSVSKEKARLAGAGAGSRRVSDQSATLRLPSIDDDSRSMASSSKNPSRTSLVQQQQHAGALGSGVVGAAVSSACIPSRRHSTNNAGDVPQQTIVPDPIPGAVVLSPADDGEESDAEDSETPWTCTLQIYPAHLPPLTEVEAKERHNFVFCASPSSSSSSSSKAKTKAVRDGRLRIRLAVLIPTPHHPKIIGQFKMPFPLPDVAITPYTSLSLANNPQSPFHPHTHQLGHSYNNSGTPSREQRFDATAGGVGARALPRAIGPDGVLRSISDSGNGEMEINVTQEILFTAEDIKDVVNSTGLWLVVREGFGGLGRTKRKGDGWHIRA
jgi:hypothetical protein